MNHPARYWSPDENSDIAPDLSHDERLWCVRQLCRDWPLYWETVDAAFQALSHRPEMDKLIREIDEDNRDAQWLDCGERPETLADVIAGITLLPALARKQCG